MRLRIRFEKLDNLKYLGHLDVMRYFEKVLRRSGLPVKYSEGFSPHMLLSFALPLSVGVTSEGEYFDVELEDTNSNIPNISVIATLLNECTTDGMRVLGACVVQGDKASKCMTVVNAADYEVIFEQECNRDAFISFLQKDAIVIEKKTKKGFKEVDVKPLILSYEKNGDASVKLRLSSGIESHLKVPALLTAFVNEYGETSFGIHRIDLLDKEGRSLGNSSENGS